MPTEVISLASQNHAYILSFVLNALFFHEQLLNWSVGGFSSYQ